jgi:prepilin-type processing-associated H-X9-DG protein
MHTMRTRRSGLGAVEVIVVGVILAVLVLVLVMALARGREQARLVACQKNLRQIGEALVLYDAAIGRLPAVPELGRPEATAAAGPLAAMRQQLGLEDFTALADPRRRPAPQPVVSSSARPVPGFSCPSDPTASAGPFPAPISYRAVAGDAPDGRTGPFAPGRPIGLAAVEAADGAGYTAAFVERLVGDGRPASPGPRNYALVPGPVAAGGCPTASGPSWRGDAGSSWREASWRSTLANHSLPPGAASSCIAADGRTARMGADSGHVGRVHVLMLDGSVRSISPAIDPTIWKGMADIGDRTPAEGDGRPRTGPG